MCLKRIRVYWWLTQLDVRVNTFSQMTNTSLEAFLLKSSGFLTIFAVIIVEVIKKEQSSFCVFSAEQSALSELSVNTAVSFSQMSLTGLPMCRSVFSWKLILFQLLVWTLISHTAEFGLSCFLLELCCLYLLVIFAFNVYVLNHKVAFATKVIDLLFHLFG